MRKAAFLFILLLCLAACGQAQVTSGQGTIASTPFTPATTQPTPQSTPTLHRVPKEVQEQALGAYHAMVLAQTIIQERKSAVDYTVKKGIEILEVAPDPWLKSLTDELDSSLQTQKPPEELDPFWSATTTSYSQATGAWYQWLNATLSSEDFLVASDLALQLTTQNLQEAELVMVNSFRVEGNMLKDIQAEMSQRVDQLVTAGMPFSDYYVTNAIVATGYKVFENKTLNNYDVSAEVQNNAPYPLSTIKVQVTTGSTGTIEVGFTPVGTVIPGGGKTSFKFSLNQYDMNSPLQIQIIGVPAKVTPPMFEVLNTTVYSSELGCGETGEVHNITDHWISMVSVVITGHDAKGQFSGTGWTLSLHHAIPPDGKSPFSISTYPFSECASSELGFQVHGKNPSPERQDLVITSEKLSTLNNSYYNDIEVTNTGSTRAKSVYIIFTVYDKNNRVVSCGSQGLDASNGLNLPSGGKWKSLISIGTYEDGFDHYTLQVEGE